MPSLSTDAFLNELTSMYERSTEKGSVWVTMKRSSLMAKVHRNKLKSADQPIDYRCLIRATDGKKTISTSIAGIGHCLHGFLRGNFDDIRTAEIRVCITCPATFSFRRRAPQVGAKEYPRFQASYGTVLKAHMTTLKKRERKEKRKTTDSDKKPEGSKKKASSSAKSS